MTKRTVSVALTAAGLAAGVIDLANAEVIISEIMYNPNSSEVFPIHYAEWIEVFNTGPEVVDITGWTIRDEDGTATNMLPETTSISSGEAIILFDNHISLSEFQSAWGSGFRAFAIHLDGLLGLSNSPYP